jgi:hypothetical protein
MPGCAIGVGQAEPGCRAHVRTWAGGAAIPRGAHPVRGRPRHARRRGPARPALRYPRTQNTHRTHTQTYPPTNPPDNVCGGPQWPASAGPARPALRHPPEPGTAPGPEDDPAKQHCWPRFVPPGLRGDVRGEERGGPALVRRRRLGPLRLRRRPRRLRLLPGPLRPVLRLKEERSGSATD